ncbi:MAG: hypothetical protein J0I06_20735 [Planctomycetes bacterium]|nr:hypothetical protein [Planctomycetota bacterium]
MRHWFGPIALVTLPFAAAADEPKFQVPKTWQKADVGRAAWHSLTALDGYAVWIDKVIVKGTEHNRAQSFTNTVYRLKAGSEKPEQIDQRVTTHGLVALLGPKGAVATGYFGDCDTVHLPGHTPISLPRGVRFQAHHFTADGLVCTGELFRDGKHHNEIVLFPLDRQNGTLGEIRALQEWFPAVGLDGFKPDFYHGRVFLRGDFVAYTGELPDPARKVGFNKRAVEVWDVRNKKVAWREEYATLEAADDRYAYWFPDPNAVARRALDGKTRAEILALPKGTVRLEVRPPRLFALVPRENGKEWVLTRLDLSTGERAEYDLRVPDDRQLISVSGSGSNRMIAVRADGDHLPLAFDAATGELRTLWKEALYTIPVAERFPAVEPKWEPLPKPK